MVLPSQVEGVMGRFFMPVGAVMADAFVSSLTWLGHVSPAVLGMTVLTSGVGVIVAANRIANGVFGDGENETA